MKSKYFYFFSIVAFFSALALIFFRYQAKEKNKAAKVYFLLERTPVAGKLEEWKEVRSQANKFLKNIQDNPEDVVSLLSLTSVYIREARVTGNYMYYDRAAMKCVNNVLEINENNFEALSLKAMIFLSEHHFAEALATAEKAVAINPYNAFIYGTLVDSHVELGNYKAAVDNLEKMISIRPDIRSYARVSYLREIHGDYPGAIEAMKLGVDAGAPGDETTAWARVQLGHLYENTGDMRMAEMNYMLALDERQGYAYALEGLGRIAVSKKRYDDAVHFYLQADSAIHDYSIKEELSTAYMLSGQPAKADAISHAIVQDMTKAVREEMQDDSIGHYSDHQLAYAWLRVNDYQKALDYALAEYNRRPQNIDVNETLAWVYYSKGDFSEAVPYIKSALKTNSKNPVLLCRAGLIFSRAGDSSAAKSLLSQVLTGNANIPVDLKTNGLKTLQTL